MATPASRTRTAYTPQTPRLFSETLCDNILQGVPEDRAGLAAAIHLAVLEDDVADMPQHLETLVGARGVRLSGGQAQRAAAARMFVRRPELLVFDDLSSALDVETEQRLWERVFASAAAGPAPRRPDRSPEGRENRAGRQPRRPAPNLGRDAALVARGDRVLTLPRDVHLRIC